jgi:hypothetical protein
MKVKSFKTIATGLVFGAFVLAFAGAAHAATNMNIYGTGEEYNFWLGAAKIMLTQSPINCTSSTTYGPNTDTPTNTKSGVTVGSGCATAYSSDNGTSDGYIYFTYTNKASWDGIDAVNNVYDTTNWGTVANPCSSSPNDTYRPVMTVSCPAAPNQSSSGCTQQTQSGLSSGYTCQSIQIGCSNLEAKGVSQTSFGNLKGPLAETASTIINRSFPAGGISTSNLPASYTINGNKYPNPSAPLAYPFAFYVTPNVTASVCSSAATIPGMVDNYCVQDSDCGTATGACLTGANAPTIDNLSRLQIVALFSGAIADWSELGPYFTAQPVTLCMRHAGAGTQSVLELAVMEPNAYGTTYTTSEIRNGTVAGGGGNCGASVGTPCVYFNDLTSDETNCLAWASGLTSFTGADSTVGIGGVIGYVDADTANGTNSKGTMYQKIRYNGVWPTRVTMDNGSYDNFWTVDRLYAAPGLDSGQQLIYAQMLAFISVPTNINSTTVSGQYLYYGTAGNQYGDQTGGELNFYKGSAFEYPYAYVKAPDTVTPQVEVEKAATPKSAAKAKK